MIGPFRAGKVNAVAGVPGNPGVYYFAADGEAFGKTTDGGVVWKPIFDKEPVCFDWSDGTSAFESGHHLRGNRRPIRFLRTAATEMESTSRWTAGKTGSIWDWRRRGISEDPGRSAQSGCGAGGGRWGTVPGRTKSGEFSVRMTAGRVGRKCSIRDNVTAAVDLCFEPGNPRVVYATLWHGIRKPGQKGTSYGPGAGSINHWMKA